MKLVQLLLISLALLSGHVIGQDSDISNEESPVLLTLTPGSDKEKLSESPIVLKLNEQENDFDEVKANDIGSSSTFKYEEPFRPNAVQPPSARPSLFQAFLAGRGGAATARPSPLIELARNFNITGRLGTWRKRIGRFRIPRLETNEKSFAFRAGRRVGLFFQSLSKRARALAERLRARAATATPTAT